MVPVVHGMPTPETMERVVAGELITGGCIVGPKKWACRSCRYEWPLPSEILSQEPVAAAMSFAQAADRARFSSGEGADYFLDNAIEVAHLLFEAGYDAQVVAAGLLHDVIGYAGVCPGEIADAVGAPVATLVEALSRSTEIADLDRRKLEHRARVARAGCRAVAVFAADALAALRYLRREYSVCGEELNRLFTMSLEEKLVHAHRDVRMIRRVDDRNPFIGELEREIEAWRTDRRNRQAACS